MKSSLENLKVIAEITDNFELLKKKYGAMITLCFIDFPEETGVYLISWNKNKNKYVYEYQNLKGHKK